MGGFITKALTFVYTTVRNFFAIFKPWHMQNIEPPVTQIMTKAQPVVEKCDNKDGAATYLSAKTEKTKLDEKADEIGQKLSTKDKNLCDDFLNDTVNKNRQ